MRNERSVRWALDRMTGFVRFVDARIGRPRLNRETRFDARTSAPLHCDGFLEQMPRIDDTFEDTYREDGGR